MCKADFQPAGSPARKANTDRNTSMFAVLVGCTGALLYVGVIAQVSYNGIVHQEDSPAGQEKTRRYCTRLCIALLYSTMTATLMISGSMRAKVDHFMAQYFRHGTKGERVVSLSMVAYNGIQVVLCLLSAYRCTIAYWKYHGPGVYGWLGLEMTNWEWTMPFLALYSDLKLLDLLDTVWIISRGSWSHFSLLHVSHHATMILPYELWLAFYDTSAPVLYTLIPLMNSVVHALLYMYYTVVLARKSTAAPLRDLAKIFHRHRGVLTCIQYTQFPTAIIVAVLAAAHSDGFLPASFCYGLIGCLNAVLFAPLLPFFKKKKTHTRLNPKDTSEQTKEKLWFVIEGRPVDVTEFQKVHPGGARILAKLKGRDVTHHFQAFHPNQSIVRKKLASLPTYTEADTGSPTLVAKGSDAKASEALRRLEAKMRERGVFEPPRAVEAWARIFEVIMLFSISVFICLWGKTHLQYDSLEEAFFTVFGGILWGFASGRCGWIQHDAGHKSFFRSKSANVLAQAISLTVGMSGASHEWNRRHNEHHAVTNEHHADPDINTTPLLMFYDEAKAYRPPSRQLSVPKWILRYQAELFSPILCPVVALAWALYAHPLACIRRRDYVTLSALGASHALRAFVAVKLTPSPLQALLFLACIWVAGPAYLFTLFAMSHTTAPIRRDEGELHWARGIFRTTVDASPRNAVASWFTGNLNCQVAHHLWPGMPTSRLSALTDDIAQLAVDLGEPYHCTTVWLALKNMYKNLKDVGCRALNENDTKKA